MHPLNERFINAMSGIERWLKATYPFPNLRQVDFSRRVSQARTDERIDDDAYRDLNELWDLRAILVHRYYQGRPPANVSLPGLVRAEQLLERLTGAIPRVADLSGGPGTVATAGPDDRVGATLRMMTQRDYSAVPVLVDGRFVALLTFDDVAHWLAGHLTEVGMLEDAAVGEVMNAGGTDYRFVARDLPQREARRLFHLHAEEYRTPLMAMLITKNGKEHEPLLGILTPWDLPLLTPAPPVERTEGDTALVDPDESNPPDLLLEDAQPT